MTLSYTCEIKQKWRLLQRQGRVTRFLGCNPFTWSKWSSVASTVFMFSGLTKNSSMFSWSVSSPLLSSSHLLPMLTYPILPCVSNPCHVAPLLPWPRAKHLLCDTSIRNFIQFPQPSVLLLSEYSFSAYVYLAKFTPIIQFPSIGCLSLKAPSLSPKMGSVALTIISHRSLGSLSVTLTTCNYVLAGPPWDCNQLTTDIFCLSILHVVTALGAELAHINSSI